MELKDLKAKYEEELEAVEKEIAEAAIKCEHLHAKLSVLDDLEKELQENNDEVPATEDTETICEDLDKAPESPTF
jgi:hypothetical protein